MTPGPDGGPPRRTTIEVQLAWLEPSADPADKPAPRTNSRPAQPPPAPAAASGAAPATTGAPPPRTTIEVQLAWLEPSADPADKPQLAPPSSRKRPPRLPGAAMTLPPMPVLPSSPPPPEPAFDATEQGDDAEEERR